MKKLLLFGAGKIGRSFIAPIFSQENYEVIFIDISQAIVEQLNQKNQYPVYIKDKVEETIWVDNVRALHSSQQEAIIEEISKCKIIAISVGQAGLPSVCKVLSEGIKKKYAESIHEKTDLIIAENLRDSDKFIRNELMKYLPVDFPIDSLVGIQETSIGKMVPIIPDEIIQKDPLAVYAEAYNTLIVSSGFLNQRPKVDALSFKDNIKAWVDRKLFIHNLGHSVAAYVGNYKHPEKKYIYEVLEDENVEGSVRLAMQEASQILQQIYPEEFTDKHLNDHINDLIGRFKNVALGDTVYRVGCDLERKLSYDDRFMSPIRHALKFKLNYSNILFGYHCAFHFQAKSDQGTSLKSDMQIIIDYQKYGIKNILEKKSGLKVAESTILKTEFQTLLSRRGILCGGNWIVDHVKVIDTFPNENMLVDIREEFVSVGGGPNNVLTNLAKLNANMPLYAVGLIGDDQDGDYISKELSKYEIDISGLKRTGKLRTSYTDVMSVSSSGNRTFFHYRGTNSLLDIQDFEIQSPARIFHLAYLLLLDKLDDIDDDYGVVAARVLDGLQKKGYKTSVDVVSSEGGRFKTIIGPCLPYIDYLIINEIEAGFTTGRKIRTGANIIDREQLQNSAKDLIRAGTKEMVIIHFPEGGYVLDRKGKDAFLPSFVVQDADIKGTTGAGDAFCAGCLFAIHEGYNYLEMLKFAHACASFNLQDPTSTGGAVSQGRIQDYIKSTPLRS